VNTARAELVDEDAMLDALNSGQVSAYATDVYRKEPPDPSPLLEHDRVILMPHAGGFTRESVDRATEGAVENLLNALENG
jgi:D-3-phosphoglycerate dehydrogenase